MARGEPASEFNIDLHHRRRSQLLKFRKINIIVGWIDTVVDSEMERWTDEQTDLPQPSSPIGNSDMMGAIEQGILDGFIPPIVLTSQHKRRSSKMS